MTETHNALNNSAHAGTPSRSSVFLRNLDRKIALSLANDHVKRELVCTLPIAAKKAATIVAATNVVAAPSDSVA